MSSAIKCLQHADRDARFTCAACRATLCEECLRRRPDGTAVCSTCLGTDEPLEFLEPDSGPYDVQEAPGASAATDDDSSFTPCAQHPENRSVAHCAKCYKAVCATCDFAFPGGIHLCPACATDPKQGLTPRRKAMSSWSIGLGIANILIVIGIELVVDTGMAKPRDALAFLGLFGCLCLVASPIGLGLGIAAFSRRSRNPGILWLGPVLNGLALAERVLVIILNATR